MKTFWLTSLESSRDIVNDLMSKMKTYGLKVEGHFWKDDLEQMAWMAPIEDLTDLKMSFWAILGSEKEFLSPDIRYGLSLLALATQAKRGVDFPVIIIQTQGDLLSTDQLPTPFKRANILLSSDSGLGSKLVTKAHGTAKKYPMNILLIFTGMKRLDNGSKFDPLIPPGLVGCSEFTEGKSLFMELVLLANYRASRF